MTESRPNAEQIEYWNTVAGPKWLEMHEQLDLQLEPYGRAGLDAASPVPGEAVIDVGCGCGSTTFQLGRAVGSAGSAFGIDIAAAMIARGGELALHRAASNVRFECADAQVFDFAPSGFDLAYSRFGVMFFADPVAAFANLARALKPTGRLAFVCWQSMADNPWMSVPMLAASQYVKLEAPTDRHAPGPFAFADAERICGLLREAGFDRPRAVEFRTEMFVAGGAPLEAALDFMLRLSPLSRSLVEVDTATREAAVAAVRKALVSYEKEGVVKMPSAAWIVTAQRGARP